MQEIAGGVADPHRDLVVKLKIAFFPGVLVICEILRSRKFPALC